jgi:hypothetical protein
MQSSKGGDGIITREYTSCMNDVVKKWDLQRTFMRTVTIHTALILVHYLGANLYTQFCTSQTLKGLLMSPFLVPAPHCQGLRWVVYNGAMRMNATWLLLGSHVVEFLSSKFVSA